MATSGNFKFALPNTGVIVEAWERIQRPLEQLTPNVLASARISLNLELLSWSNETWNFWKTVSGTIPLVAGQATYQLPANLVTMENLIYTQVNGLGAGINNDRIMVPMERTQYAELVNKLEPGIPTQYWLQMLAPIQISIWQVPQEGQTAPAYELTWYGLQQIQDANLSQFETPDIVYRAYDALCARMALRLCEKFGPNDPGAKGALMKEKAALAEDAWQKLQRRDQEQGPTRISPNVSSYGRITL